MRLEHSVVGMTYCNANSPHHQSKTPSNTAFIFIQAMKPQPPTSGFNMIIISGGGGGD